jgi:hypothetical protein
VERLRDRRGLVYKAETEPGARIAGGGDFFLAEEGAAGVSSLRGRSDGETVVGFGLRGNGTGRGRLDQRRWTAVRPSLFLLGIGMEE